MKTQTLYKIDNNETIRVWWGETGYDYSNQCDYYEVNHGVDGGAIQTKRTYVECGKNLGKSNETTPQKQAELELDSKFNKQLDKLYTTDASGLTLSIRPMLAQSFDKHGHKIKYPCFLQPKLDGIRCLGFPSGKLMSRKGKYFSALDHIAQAISKLNLDSTFVLDGELYVHGKGFQSLASLIKRDKVHKDSHKIEYHVYDMIIPGEQFEVRTNKIQDLVRECSIIKIVKTLEIKSEDDVASGHQAFLSEGYEGSIIRNKDGLYESDKRSYNLQKLKDFIDEEFEIIGGKLDKDGGCVFHCKTNDNKEFSVRPQGSIELREQYYNDLPNLVGRLLTVRFFEWTDENKPRFPSGICVRDYE